MDRVGTLAIDPHFRWSERVVLDLHFDICHFQRDKAPGLLRTEPIYVTARGSSEPAYEGPDAGEVPSLLAEVVRWLDRGDPKAHVVIRAAMAHLHLVTVHPFKDGNGRVSRVVQSLVLAREGLLLPEFGSIEEHLARNTQACYDVLQEVQGGSYQPSRNARPWVELCVDAHIEQARRRIKQTEQASQRWERLEALIADKGWPDRLVIALEQALFGGVDRVTYAAEAGVSPATASADLRRLTDAGLLEQQGRGRNTRYAASPDLRRTS